MFLIAILINLVVMAFLYPELFVRIDFRMVQGHETCGPMQYVFFLIGQFYQGGIQLFNRYDLLPGAFTQLSVGLYTPFNFIIALGYVLFSPFVENSAQFFHHWYVFVYYALGLALRTFGFYILAFYMTKSRLIAVLTTIWANSFCALTLIHMGGLCISQVYNYLPLLLFCLVYYWETRSFKAIIASIVIFTLAANNAMYVGLGYFYQTLHLYLFDMLMIWLLVQRRKKPLLSDRIDWSMTARAVLAIIVILLPVAWWGMSLPGDYEMFDSGLGESHGRFNRIYNPVAMMNDPLRHFLSFDQVLNYAWDYTVSGWYVKGAFLGITTLVLAVFGLILGRHPYKIVFISAAIMMAFLNVPSNKGGWMMWAHWVDTITNPFCFLVRSFHYTVLLWYLTLAIPVGLGIAACIAMVRGKFEAIYAGRLFFLKCALAVVWVACFFIGDPLIREYAIKVLGIFLVFLAFFDRVPIQKVLRILLAVSLALVIVKIEFSVLHKYINVKSDDMNLAYWDGLRVKPRIFNPMYTPPVPMVLDYQNPKILPVRFFYRTDDQVVWPLLVEFQGMFGQFYQYMPLVLRLERPSSMYVPRMKIFKNIDQNKQIQEYIRRDGRVMYVADAAISPNTDDYDRVLTDNLDRRIIQVEKAHLDQVKALRDIRLPETSGQLFKQSNYDFPLTGAVVRKRPEGIEYQWDLPKEFPRYLSTTVFTPDVSLWELKIGDVRCIPAQGALVYPFTFDVNNIKEGRLTLLVPADMDMSQSSLQLKVRTPSELIDVWRNSHDQFGFTYNNPRDGWWVIHMPYDPKWKLTIDGVKTPISKINQYFIGAPLSAGEHKILLSYWPESPLRILIILSTLSSWILMFVVFRWTYLWSKEKSDQSKSC